jgi:arylsulfatase A-like enzyme
MPELSRPAAGCGYDTAYFGKYHMGEDNDEPRPGSHWFVTHKGQGKYFDTEWNIHGKERKVIKGYYTTVVTDMARTGSSSRATDKPWCHDRPQSPAQLLHAGAQV